MKVALYARVSTESQEARGTIGSQLETLRVFARGGGHDIVSEFLDDGHSGSRLNRPGLDALRDAAEAGLFEAVLCLTPDRLARAFAHQYIVLEELARHQVRVIFSDAPPLDDDPQARLLVQMQGVIAEYERSKITERHRRGKLFRARMGEVISWSVPYGYRRVPRSPHSPPHVEIFEPEAEVVRRIYDDYVNGGFSVRQIAKRLFADGVPTPFGRKPVWHESTLSRILRNPAYIGTLYYNVRETTKRPTRTGKQGHTERQRPEEEWITIPIPAILADDLFEAAQRVAQDNSRFSPRHLKNEAWLLRSLVVCGTCESVLGSVQYPGRTHPMRYYRCPKMGQNLERALTNCRCPQRQVRADELDEFVFGELRTALLRPQVLLAGQTALAERVPSPDDELLDAQLRHLDRKLEQADAERRRLVDLYQAGLLELADLQRRAKDIEARRRHLDDQRGALIAQRRELARDNQVRQRVADFARLVSQGLDAMNFEHRQRLVRLLIEEVRIVGWKVEMRLRIPLDDGPHPAPQKGPPAGKPAVSTTERLRSSHQYGGLVTTQSTLSAGSSRSTSRASPRYTLTEPFW